MGRLVQPASGRTRVGFVVAAGVMALALATTLAVVADTADTATGTIESGDPVVPTDLAVSIDDSGPYGYTASPPGNDCDTNAFGGAYTQDQSAATTLVSVTGASPASMDAGAQVTYVCLKNAGTGSIGLSGEAITELVDSELACGPGEAAVDSTCGSGAGELASELRLQIYVSQPGGLCQSPTGGGHSEADTFDDLLTTTSQAVTNVGLAFGESRCVALAVGYLDNLTTPTERLANLSDRTTFRVRFTATGS